MNRQEKIDFIYQTIADKTLSFWCIIRRETNVWDILDFKIIQNRLIKFDNWKTRREIQLYHSNNNQVWIYTELDDKEIIWHPVMIWDILEYFYGDIRFSDFAWIWKKLRKPLEKQDDECIDFIYDMIKKKK